ncbi:hypothetical protein LRP67_05605 [Nocardioides sp. cx-169]|jgi:hypothetical protein|uniref:hypothetical protein n=1 Tax=Nocardioides sp. cx-169 TaxID=2899080 RepID=UPI001E5AC3FF|nr:hypothetical protein [Nocardioides sp. cx-169]MCD4533551.1 hypothetical protein [Nocardioides sp. cx-169]
MTISTEEPFGPDDERRLNELGLSSALIHDGLRRGASRANNRTARALPSSRGTDIYYDGMEDFHILLAENGWSMAEVRQQPRLFHPKGVVSFTLSAGKNVGLRNMRTDRKGPATRESLAEAPFVPSLFPDLDEVLLKERASHERLSQVPFYLLLIERIAGERPGLRIELAQPVDTNDSGCVVVWGERIKVHFFDLDGDLSAFDDPDADGGDEFDVPVAPR